MAMHTNYQRLTKVRTRLRFVFDKEPPQELKARTGKLFSTTQRHANYNWFTINLFHYFKSKISSDLIGEATKTHQLNYIMKHFSR